MAIRGIRGAAIAAANEAGAIATATKALLQEIMMVNPTLETADIASAFFTVTDDLNASYPALAARELGWHEVPLLCAREIPVPGSMPMCIRVLIQWNTELPQKAVQYVYLGEAARLRPDLQPANGSINPQEIGARL
ncbi:MAG: chorismate mutase [Ardenticatenaceae bacterium]|nr:chorismate mutase [Ardenticatenaceae bacterium]